jgi:hypothetical protein
MPFAESPWEIELSFGCGWQIESVGILSARSIEAYERERSGRREIPGYGKTLCLEEHFTSVMALSRSWVLLVNRAGRSQPACLYFNALGHSLPSQIGWKITYSWPM